MFRRRQAKTGVSYVLSAQCKLRRVGGPCGGGRSPLAVGRWSVTCCASNASNGVGSACKRGHSGEAAAVFEESRLVRVGWHLPQPLPS